MTTTTRLSDDREKLAEIRRLLENVAGINDERDSVPLLLAIRDVVKEHAVVEIGGAVPVSATVSISQQIEEVEREIALRKRVYPGLVLSKRMRNSVAAFHLERMKAVLETLREIEAKAFQDTLRHLEANRQADHREG